jgi:hypothetical protein
MDADMSGKTKIVVFFVLVVLGLGLLAYGAVAHSTAVLAQQQGQETTLAKSEPSLIKEVSVGGVERDEAGKIKQTYEVGQQAPEACPT